MAMLWLCDMLGSALEAGPSFFSRGRMTVHSMPSEWRGVRGESLSRTWELTIYNARK